MIYLLIMGLTFHSYEPTLNGEGRELVVRKDVVQNGQWNSSGVNTYANSTIDNWFNGTYKGYFSQAVQALIESTTFYYTPKNGIDYEESLERSVYSLSLTELGLEGDASSVEGTALPIAQMLQIAQLNGNPVPQWTRSPVTGVSNINNVYCLTSSGEPVYNYCSNAYGYRSCFTLPSTALVTGELELVEG